jgi:hypothetical protein
MPDRIVERLGGYVAQPVAAGAVVACLGGLLPTLLSPQTAMSQPTLQPPVTPACVSSPFGWRHAVGPHAPAGFHNGIRVAW